MRKRALICAAHGDPATIGQIGLPIYGSGRDFLIQYARDTCTDQRESELPKAAQTRVRGAGEQAATHWQRGRREAGAIQGRRFGQVNSLVHNPDVCEGPQAERRP